MRLQHHPGDDCQDDTRQDETYEQDAPLHQARPDEVKAALVNVQQTGHGDALFYCRELVEYAEVPQEQQHKQRDVAVELDVDQGDAADQPVRGEPCQANDKA